MQAHASSTAGSSSHGFRLDVLTVSLLPGTAQVPLVAATMGMYDINAVPQDAQLWQLIALCAGTSASTPPTDTTTACVLHAARPADQRPLLMSSRPCASSQCECAFCESNCNVMCLQLVCQALLLSACWGCRNWRVTACHWLSCWSGLHGAGGRWVWLVLAQGHAMGFGWLRCGQCHVHRTTWAATSSGVMICVWLFVTAWPEGALCAEAAFDAVDVVEKAVQCYLCC